MPVSEPPRTNSILRNTTFLMMGNVLQRVLTFATAIIITRYLGPQHYGKYTFVIALVSIMEIVWHFGLNPVYVREVSRDRSLAADFAGGMIVTRTYLAVAAFPLILAYLYLMGYSPAVITAVVIFVAGKYLMAILLIYQAVFSAYKRMGYTSLLNTIYSVSLLVTIILITRVQGGLVQIFSGYLLSFFVTFVAMSLVVRREFFTPRFTFRWKQIVAFARMGAPFLLINITYIILHKIDHLMLSKMRGDTELGFYGAAYTLFEIIIVFFPITVINAAYPVLSEYYHKNLDLMQSIFNTLMKAFLFIGLPISCGFVLLGRPIILAFFGEAYDPAGSVLVVLGGAIAIFFVSNLLSWTLTAADRQVMVLYCTLAAMISNIVLNIFFIQSWGGLGAAWATLISELVKTAVLVWQLKVILKFRFRVNLVRTVAGTAVMGAFVVYLREILTGPDHVANLLINVAVSGAAYLLIGYFLRTITFRELKSLSRN